MGRKQSFNMPGFFLLLSSLNGKESIIFISLPPLSLRPAPSAPLLRDKGERVDFFPPSFHRMNLRVTLLILSFPFFFFLITPGVFCRDCSACWHETLARALQQEKRKPRDPFSLPPLPPLSFPSSKKREKRRSSPSFFFSQDFSLGETGITRRLST